MANITELQFQGDSTVHKLNDARITTTAVTTATHILTTNSGLTSIAPITAVNLASLLGAHYGKEAMNSGDLNNLITNQCLVVDNRTNGLSNVPSNFTSMGILTVTSTFQNYGTEQRLYVTQNPNINAIYYRYKWGNSWSSWYRNDNYGTTSLSELASALGGSLKESLVRSFDYDTCKTWGTGLYFLFCEDSTSSRYALVYVAHTSDGYAVTPIGDTADFGTDAQKYNLLYQINSDGVKFRTGSTLPCYIKKLM